MRFLVSTILGIALTLSTFAGAAAATPAGASPQTAIPLGSVVSGHTVGSGSGSYVYYTFDYPGQNVYWTLTLSFAPNDFPTANAVGVNLYQSGPLLASMNGVGNPRGTHALAFQSNTVGPMLVQLYNFAIGVPVDYQLSLTGPGAPTAPAATSSTPAAIAPASSPPQAASGSLVGNVAGSYAYYTVQYSGGAAQAAHLNFAPNAGNVAFGIYVVAYQNGVKIGEAHGSDANPPGVLPVWYQSDAAGPVTLQIGNYNQGVTAYYSISQ
jgi:hypothetical protein